MEAGLGTLSRMPEGSLDLALVVVEPGAKSLEVGRRAIEMLRERKVAPWLVIANKVRGQEDVDLVRRELALDDVHVVPEDEAIVRADMRGVSAYDSDPDSPAVRAVRQLGERLQA